MQLLLRHSHRLAIVSAAMMTRTPMIPNVDAMQAAAFLQVMPLRNVLWARIVLLVAASLCEPLRPPPKPVGTRSE